MIHRARLKEAVHHRRAPCAHEVLEEQGCLPALHQRLEPALTRVVVYRHHRDLQIRHQLLSPFQQIAQRSRYLASLRMPVIFGRGPRHEGCPYRLLQIHPDVLPCACSRMCFWLFQAVCSGGLCSDTGDASRPCRQPLSLEISVPFGYRYSQLLVYPLAKIHVHLQLADFSMEGIALLVEISGIRLRSECRTGIFHEFFFPSRDHLWGDLVLLRQITLR